MTNDPLLYLRLDRQGRLVPRLQARLLLQAPPLPVGLGAADGGGGERDAGADSASLLRSC